VLHYRPEDLALRTFFTSAVPKAGDLKRLLVALGSTTDLREAARQAGMSARRATALANLFEEAGVLRVQEGHVEADGDVHLEEAVSAARERAESRKRIDESRLAMMRAYAETSQCRRQFLLGYFGDEETGLCHNCDTCESGEAERYAEQREPSAGADPFPVDTEVRHREWGDGRVMSIEEDRITVFFESEGYRVLSLEAVEERDLLERVES